MGAKQSKRSVDISGKEAEGAGEVAAAGAGGEGRVEALADVDALKPQLNGDAHIHDQTEKEKQLDSGTPENEKDATTEKEEKEQENESEKEKEVAPVTNGESEAKPENGESTPAPEDGKKPKKEKVKKKWSLRSISFSRKDKPKQEKKQKEEETKTNGEPEKVPEEAAEVTPETAANEVAEEAKPESEAKEEKTPETPVTEPLTNGSSTPESPKVDIPVEEAAPAPAPEPAPAPAAPAAASPETEKPEPKVETQPEQLPVNGLSLEEPKIEAPEVPKPEESKPEEPTAETTETVPAPEIPVKKEVCVEQMPLEPTPPPLPANPPPSSVASFAATTMAPELTDASLANTTELVISAPPIPDTKADKPDEVTLEPQTDLTTTEIVNITEINSPTELPPPLKETTEEKPVEAKAEPETVKIELAVIEKTELPETELDIEKIEPPTIEQTEPPAIEQTVAPAIEQTKPLAIEQTVLPAIEQTVTPAIEQTEPPAIEETELPAIKKVEVSDTSATTEINVPNPESNVDTFETVHNEVVQEDDTEEAYEKSLRQGLLEENYSKTTEIETTTLSESDKVNIVEPAADLPDAIEDLPPPLPLDDYIPTLTDIEENMKDTVPEDIETIQENNEIKESVINANHISDNTDVNIVNSERLNGNDETEQENLKNKAKDSLSNLEESIECNGNIELKKDTIDATIPVKSLVEEAGAMTPSLSTEDGAVEEFPPPPSELCGPDAAPTPPPASPDVVTPQEAIPVSDKLADLIPEVPVVPELNTETLQETTSDVAVAN